MVFNFLKNMYFPKEDQMIANLGNRSSLAWRSILAGREILNNDLHRRVGNGRDMHMGCSRG
ncbi:hypothetical protein Sjap_017862 [Stephania japonica]|uniref:Uncharacterized protein n=1 Tax=Stephania japonica TaxID=461633 RepID=A0AAP0I6Y2_9MAGN